MKLLKVSRPAGPLTPHRDGPVIVRGHTLSGWYDEQDNYYEHDETTDRWYLLDDEADA